jgi:hypothetical protein
MERTAIDRIREAVRTAQQAVHSGKLDSCDIDDIDEIITTIDRELARPTPNKNTLTTYLNSLAHSLSSLPHTREVGTRLDAAMREAGVPLN